MTKTAKPFDVTPEAIASRRRAAQERTATLKTWLLFALGIPLMVYACLTTCSLFTPRPGGDEDPVRVEPVAGWLCDHDGFGRVLLYDGPGDPSEHKVVGVDRMCPRGCLSVTKLQTAKRDYILYYEVDTGEVQGWVDVDYYYPLNQRPDWGVACP